MAPSSLKQPSHMKLSEKIASQLFYASMPDKPKGAWSCLSKKDKDAWTRKARLVQGIIRMHLVNSAIVLDTTSAAILKELEE